MATNSDIFNQMNYGDTFTLQGLPDLIFKKRKFAYNRGRKSIVIGIARLVKDLNCVTMQHWVTLEALIWSPKDRKYVRVMEQNILQIVPTSSNVKAN